jgi:hypothetical protein
MQGAYSADLVVQPPLPLVRNSMQAAYRPGPARPACARRAEGAHTHTALGDGLPAVFPQIPRHPFPLACYPSSSIRGDL